MSDIQDAVARAWITGYYGEDHWDTILDDGILTPRSNTLRGAESLMELLSDAPRSVLSDPPDALVRQSAEVFLNAYHRQETRQWHDMWNQDILRAARTAILALAKEWGAR